VYGEALYNFTGRLDASIPPNEASNHSDLGSRRREWSLQLQ